MTHEAYTETHAVIHELADTDQDLAGIVRDNPAHPGVRRVADAVSMALEFLRLTHPGAQHLPETERALEETEETFYGWRGWLARNRPNPWAVVAVLSLAALAHLSWQVRELRHQFELETMAREADIQVLLEAVLDRQVGVGGYTPQEIGTGE